MDGGVGQAEYIWRILRRVARHGCHWLAGRARSHRRLHLRERLLLGDHRWVGILACDGREFLIAATRQGLALLAELDEPDPTGRPLALGLRRPLCS